jgi:hypothetical protein
MLKRIPWKENAVLSFQLGDDLFTLAQMRTNSLMEFFDVFRSTADWAGTDLNQAPIIFCAYAAENRFKAMINEILPAGLVVPNARPVARRMLSPIIEADGKYGASLVELDDTFQSVNAKLIQADLDPVKDTQTIYQHELTGMIGDPEKLRKRLTRYAETGVNWDDSKSFLFPGIPLPPASPRS